jgi:hypothetical protein
MSEHPASGHAIAGILMVLIIAGLATWGFSIMNSGAILPAAVAGVILAGFGSYAVLALGPD